MKALKNSSRVLSLLSLLFLISCASRVLKYDKTEDLRKIKEFEQTVKIEVVEPPLAKPLEAVASKEGATATEAQTGSTAGVPKTSAEKIADQKDPKTDEKKSQKSKKSKNAKKKGVQPVLPVDTRRQPEIESQLGFNGRRPIVDPFRVGEKIVHEVSYFKMKAGTMTIETKPNATVNGVNSYHFQMAIKSSDFFSKFYAVDDYVETWMDYENLVPSVFQLHVRETSQIREARAFFDFTNKKASFWERKVTEKSGEEDKKLEWEIPEFSQNVYSAVFYLRTFQWPDGGENVFRVAHDNENLIFRAKTVRREEISTDAGKFKAVVIKPEIELKGVFRPVGDIFIWLSDDDRKLLLRIESKIKIGTLISEVIQITGP